MKISSTPVCSYASLDIDNTLGGDNGQETVTVVEGGDKIYTIFVEDYSEDSNYPLTKSRATATVFR